MSISTPRAGSTSTGEPEQPTWGLGDALVGWGIAFVFAQLVGGIVLVAGGFTTKAEIEAAPLTWTMAASLPIWIAFVVITVVVGNWKGNGWVADFHVSLRAIDVPVGIVTGVVAQFVLVPLIALPVLKLTGQDADDLAKPAQDLADKVHGVGGPLLFLLVVGLVGGWLLAGRMLAPLTRITGAARKAANGSLVHRIELEGSNDEFRELADAFDMMLVKLEAQVGEQQRFAANASHELRTPLAVMQAILDVAVRDPSPDGREERLRAVNARAIALTEALLLLSRVDRRSFAHEDVDLSSPVAPNEPVHSDSCAH